MESSLINNLIPRLKSFAEKIEVKEAIVDKIWEIYSDEDNLHDYQFLRDNRLIMTHQGNVKKGRWELLPGNRLLIERENDSPINLVYDFSLQGIVIMKKAGINQIPFLLLDQNVVLNRDLESYLISLLNELEPRPYLEQSVNKEKNEFSRVDMGMLIVSMIILITALFVFFVKK